MSILDDRAQSGHLKGKSWCFLPKPSGFLEAPTLNVNPRMQMRRRSATKGTRVVSVGKRRLLLAVAPGGGVWF